MCNRGKFKLVAISMALLLCCSACRNDSTAPMPPPGDGTGQSASGVFELPALAELDLAPTDGGQRSASSQRPELGGADWYAKSKNGVAAAGSFASFAAAEGGAAWAVWGFEMCDCEVIEELSYKLSSRSAGPNVWLALANFARGRWDLQGPLDEDAHAFVPEGSSTDFISPAGRVYIALIAWDGASWTVEKVGLQRPDASFPGWVHSLGNHTKIGANLKTTRIALAPDGTIYTASSYTETGAAEKSRLLLAHLDTSGNVLDYTSWKLADESTAGEEVWVGDICCGPGGELYLAGATSSDGLASGFGILLKFDAALNLLWSRRVAPQGGHAIALTDMGRISLDSSGQLLCLGATTAFHDNYGFQGILLRVSDSGTLLASQRASSTDPGLAAKGAASLNNWIELAEGAGLVFCGSFSTFDSSDPQNWLELTREALLLKVKPDQSIEWARGWNGGPGRLDALSALVENSLQEIVCVGIDVGSGGISPVHDGTLVLAFDSGGNLLRKQALWRFGANLRINEVIPRAGGNWAAFGSMYVEGATSGLCRLELGPDFSPGAYEVFGFLASPSDLLDADGQLYFLTLNKTLCLNPQDYAEGSDCHLDGFVEGATSSSAPDVVLADMTLDWTDPGGQQEEPLALQDIAQSGAQQSVFLHFDSAGL